MNLTESMEAFIRLVQIPSVTGSSREKEACAFLENILSQYGISSERIARSEERPNLLACLRAEHPEEEPVILISHVDVVDGNQECWSHPVFGGERQAGRIWGRGTLDTKQLTMMELYTFLRLKEKQKELRRDVWFLATIDEEGGSSYGMEYVKSVRPELFRNAMVFNEGGGFPLRINGRDYMMLTVGEKGVLKVRIWAEGTGGHASAPGDDQAIQKLAEALRKIFAAEEKLACGSRHTQDTMREIAGTDEWDNPVAADIFGYAGQNSIGMRNYQIGERSNVIPAKAEVILEFKVLPGTSKEDIQEFLDRELSGTAAKYEILSFEPGFESRFDCSGLKELVQDLNTACEHFGFQGQVMPMLALGRTDGRFFGSEGSLVYGCSPLLMGDSFDVVLPKVHGNDESILEESYLFGCRVMDEILQKNCLKRKKIRRIDMKDYSYHKKVIEDVTEKLNELDIDLYLIITAEGCDPMTSFIPGVDTVGSSAFLFARDGRRLAIASSIDAQDVEESGLFDEVIRYETYDDTLARTVISLKPARIALDYSENVPFCDGLTMGKYEKFVKFMGDYSFDVCSADLFIPDVQRMNAR